jgi:soluble lytic murein transglycosylase
VGILATILAVPLWAFNFEREVGGYYQKYYNWDPSIFDDTQFPNPYIGALTRLRVNDYSGAARWARNGIPNPNVAPYANYIAFVAALKAKDQSRIRPLESKLLALDNPFITQLVALEWVDSDLLRKDFGSAEERIRMLGDVPKPSEVEEKLLILKVKKGLESRTVIDTVTAYRQLRALYPDSDRSGDLLDTMRRRFSIDFRLEELLNTPELRSAYCMNLFDARQYKTLIGYTERVFPRRFDFGANWPTVLRQVGIAYMELGHIEKARETFFILSQISGIDPRMMAEATTFHSILVRGSGTPFYDDSLSTKALQAVVNDLPLSPIAPRAFYALSQFFLNENRSDDLAKVLRRFRRFYNETEPYLLRISWEQQIHRINEIENLNVKALDSRFKVIIGSPAISQSMLSWLQSRFQSSRKGGSGATSIVEGFRTVPLSYQAAWALKEWGSVNANESAQVIHLNDPMTRKYDLLFQMGLGELALREIEHQSVNKKSEMVNYNHIRLLLKMKQFGRGIEQARSDLGMAGTDLYRIPPGWIDMLYPQVYWDEIQKNCRKYDLDPYFVLAILREDSRFEYGDIQTRDTSHLFKIKSTVLKDVSIRLGDPWTDRKEFMTPDRAIRYAVFYIAWLRDNFDDNLLYTITAYGTDPEMATQLIRGSKNNNHSAIALMNAIPYPETRAYIQNVLDSYVIYSLIYPNNTIKFKRWKLPDETH